MKANKKLKCLLLALAAVVSTILGDMFLSKSDAQAATHKHSYTWVTVVNPTCKSQGRRDLKCSCGHVSNSATIASVPHSTTVYQSHVNGDCLHDGYDVYRCQWCNYTVKKNVKKGNHNYTWVVMQQPTCTTGGYRNYKCTICGNTTNSASIDKIPHSMAYSYHVNGDCTHDSYDVYKCKNCSYTSTANVVKGSHSYGWVTVVAPSCTATGRRDYRCSTCGNVTNSASIDKVPHNLKVERREPTYTTDGYEKKYCTNCPYVEYNYTLSKKPITVTYDTASGRFPNQTTTISKTVTYGAAYGKVDTPSKDGYTFLGWFTGVNGGSAISETSIVNVAGNHTAYAHWLKNTAINPNTSQNSYHFIVDTFGIGEDWAYYFVASSDSTKQINKPAWIDGTAIDRSNNAFSFTYNNRNQPKAAYIYVYSKASGKAATYKISAPSYYKVTVYSNGTPQYYYVDRGETFTFPSTAPQAADGQVFIGWMLQTSEPSIVGYNLPGATIPINANSTFKDYYTTIYEKLGSVYDSVLSATYDIWMVQLQGEAAFYANHSGNNVVILDNFAEHDYCVVNSFAHTDENFIIQVCGLIIQYNSDNHRTAYWDRSIVGCVDEWREHNVAFSASLAMLAAGNDWYDWADLVLRCASVNLDATGHHYIPAEIMNYLREHTNLP